MSLDADTLKPKEQNQVRLLCDGEMYRLAEDFARNTLNIERIENKQLMGLVQYSQSWSQLKSFVRHQKNRDWGSREWYRDFYMLLDGKLDVIYADVKRKYQLVPEGLTKARTIATAEKFAGLLAADFIQHLTAEMMLDPRRRKSD
mgnify:CR=1 FL=1